MQVLNRIAFCLLRLLSFLFLPLVASALQSQSGDSTLTYSVFLIGDVGAPSIDKQEPTLTALQTQLQADNGNSTLIFLGDNIYPKGLPDSLHKDRPEAQRYLEEQLKITDGYAGKVVFIPGNHDWARSGRQGWQRVQLQEKFVEAYLKRGNTYFPDDGCPGPVEIPLSDELVLVVIDTQWFLHPWDKPGEESDCENKTADQILVQLDDILKRNAHRKVLVTSHHPMYTYGSHGGRYTLKQHLFPLTDLQEDLWIPLPIIGSIYPLYRTLLGDPQDTPNPKFKLMRKALTGLFKQHPNLIQAAGHEHALQYITRDSLHYIVSGAGCKRSHVAKGKYAQFVDPGEGFGRLNYYSNGAVWLEFYKPEENSPNGKLVYRQRLMMQPFQPQPSAEEAFRNMNLPDSIQAQASEQYKAGPFKTWILGANYRDVWQQPIQVPVFDIGAEKGGLTILQRGGGMQTKSLRLENKEGKQYTLRSIEKFAEGAIPGALKNTFAVDLVQDQISASHPYASLVVPTLADAAKVYHTNPKVVFIPNDPRLGQYQPAFGNTLALFEERPAGDGSDNTSLGGSKKLYSTDKMLEKLHGDNDNAVDQIAVLRARLFDLFIADWDRHDDQWRWASFEGKHGLIFQPIPRDRDQVFFVNQGILPRIASRKWVMPKLQGFDYRVRDVNTFMNNARYFDRSFLTEPSLEQWVAMADSLKEELTDEVIARALANWPKEIYRLTAPEVEAKLKARREKLSQYAREYYLFLAREIDIPGSNKQEYFEVTRLDDAHTRVRVHKISKSGDREQKIYERTFNTGETREIRLYGLDGDDVFQINGKVNKGILVRIIGGNGNDQITDDSRVKRLSRKTKVYDTASGNELKLSSESANLTSNAADVNNYNRKAFKYNFFGPLASVEFNIDDGLFLGGGVMARTQGFRKEPYATQHTFTANYAFATASYHFRYRADFTDVIGKLDLSLDADLKQPNYVNNFFGLGNETTYTLPEDGITYYRVRFGQGIIKTLLRKKLNENANIYFGPTFQSIQVERTKGRFIEDTALNGLDGNSIFKQKYYGGVNAGIRVDKRDSKMLPTTGFVFGLEGEANKGFGKFSSNFGYISSALSLYWTFRLPARVTLATRFGGGLSLGKYEFFQAQILGGNTNLRGFRKTRFAGESALYQNTELRIKLFSFRSYLFPAQVGIIGFNDVGRVWQDGEKSSTWHHGYGGGVYLAPLNQLVISFMYGFSKEDNLPLVRAGFLF